MAALTKSQVNKAGKTLRQRFGPGGDPENGPSAQTLVEAFELLWAYRAIHQYPLTKANNGLRSVVKTEGCQVEVSQRLKRLPTIINKLMREPTMQLGNMQDIAGCRAVLGSIDEVRRVQKRFVKNRPPLRVTDYITQPRTSGYRGVHLIVEYDGRSIEVQLRTRVMHEWAITVERLSGRLSVDLKSGSGPPELLGLLRAASAAMALEETGAVVGDDLLAEMAQLRQDAVRFLAGGSG